MHPRWAWQNLAEMLSSTPFELAYGNYVASMIEDFPVKLEKSDTTPTPAADDLLSGSTGDFLDKTRAEEIHTMVARGLFLCKRARPDVHPGIAVLCTQVQKPPESDWQSW